MRDGERLTLTVTDNGRGFVATPREGVGITNARKRLAQLYDRQSLSIAARTRGVVVTVELPFHKEPDEHPSADRGRRALGAHADRLAAEG